MEKEIVTFKGIARNTDPGISDDGYCAELINGRIANGSIVPMGKPVIKQRFGKPYDKIFKHTGSGFENLICTYGYDIDAYIKHSECTTAPISNIVPLFLCCPGEENSRMPECTIRVKASIILLS
jgi:hypothetical protein